MTRTTLTLPRTPLCDLFEIDLPLLALPLGDESSLPDRVAAVANAGPLAILAAAGLPAGRLRAAIRAIRAATDRPFGVHLILDPPAADASLDGRDPSGESETLADRIRVILDETPPLFVITGDPAGVVELAHAAAIKIGAVIGSVAEARRAVALGVDLLIVCGAGDLGPLGRFAATSEASALGIFALAPAVADAVRAPVVLADAMVDGRGLLAALALGAAGVLLVPPPPRDLDLAADTPSLPAPLADPDAALIDAVIARAAATLDRLTVGLR